MPKICLAIVEVEANVDLRSSRYAALIPSRAMGSVSVISLFLIFDGNVPREHLLLDDRPWCGNVEFPVRNLIS